jgi:hypothetical protein
MIAHVVEEKLEGEKVRRKIGFSIYNNFFPLNLFSLLILGNVRDIL